MPQAACIQCDNNEGRDGGYGDQTFSPGFRTNALRSTLLVHGQLRTRRCGQSKRVANTGRRRRNLLGGRGHDLSLLHARLIKGRKWAAWLRSRGRSSQRIQHAATSCFTSGLEARATDLDGMTLTEAYAAFGITRFTEIASSNESEPDHRHRLSSNGIHKLASIPPGTQVRDHLDPDDEEGILRAATKSASGATRSGPRSSSRKKRRLGRSSTGSEPGPSPTIPRSFAVTC